MSINNGDLNFGSNHKNTTFNPAAVKYALGEFEKAGGKIQIIEHNGNNIQVTTTKNSTTFKNIGSVDKKDLNDKKDSTKKNESLINLGGFELGFIMTNIPSSDDAFCIKKVGDETMARITTLKGKVSFDLPSSKINSPKNKTNLIVSSTEKEVSETTGKKTYFNGANNRGGAIALATIQAGQSIAPIVAEINQNNIESVYKGNDSISDSIIKTLLSAGDSISSILISSAQAQETGFSRTALKKSNEEPIQIPQIRENTKNKTSNTIGFTQEDLDAINSKNDPLSPISSSGRDFAKVLNEEAKKNRANTPVEYMAKSNTLIVGAKNNTSSLLNPEAQKAMDSNQAMAMSTMGINSKIQELFGVTSPGVEMVGGKPVVTIGQQLNFDGTSSCVLLGKFGAPEKEILAACGLSVGPDRQIFVSGEHFMQARKFGGTNKEYDASQDKVGVTFRYIPHNSFVKIAEIKTEYSKSPNVDIETRNIIKETSEFFDQTKLYDQFVGAKKFTIMPSGTINIGENGELKIGLGVTRTTYNDGQSKSNVTTQAEYTQYMGDSKITGSVRKDGDRKEGGIYYGHEVNFGKIAGSIDVGVVKASGMSGVRYAARLNLTESDQKSGISFKRPKQGDIGPVSINTLNYARGSQSHFVEGKEVTNRVHETSVKLGDGVSIEKNADGTLLAINIDSGVNNLVSIDSVNPSQYTNSFSIQNGRFLRITNFEKLPAPANFKITALDSNGTYTLYTFDTVAGSTNLRVAPTTLHNVPKEFLSEFKNGKSFAEITQMIQNGLPKIVTVTGVTDGGEYGVAGVTPSWEELPGSTYTATLNGAPYTKGSLIKDNGPKELIITTAKGGKTVSTKVNFTIDTVGPTMSSPVYSVDTNGKTVTVTILSGEDIQAPAGWIKKNGKTPTSFEFTKVYSDNTSETVVFFDKYGNKTEVNVVIDKVDKIAPIATSEKVETAYNTAKIGIDVLANDTDDSGIKPTLTGVLTNRRGGTFTISAGKIDFIPTPGFVGSATVTYEIQDRAGNKSEGELTVEVLNRDLETIKGAPTTTSVTSTGVTVVNHITDADGIQNVTYYVYSDAGGTALVASNTTGVFTGLSAGTTYYVKTTAEAKNGTTNAYVLQTSSLASVNTLNAPDTTPPSAPTISINSGATVTNSTTVNLSLSGTDDVGVTGWFVSESSSVPAPGDFGSKPSNFTLSGGDGAKTIYVWTRDAAGNISSTASSTITLDTVVNTSNSANITSVNQGTSISQSLSFGEAVKVISGATIGGAIISVTGSYSTSVSVSGTAAAPASYSGNITVEDAAGNQKVITVNFTVTGVDTTLPSTPSITINSGATVTSSTTVNLSLSGTDDVGVTGWFVSESSSTPALGSFGVKPTSFAMSGGDGAKTIYVWTRDAAGNISGRGSSTITLDTIVNTGATANLTQVDEFTAISQTLTFGEAVKVVTGNTIGGAIIPTTGSYSTTVSVTGTAATHNSYIGTITVEDAAGNQKVITINFITAEVI